MTIGIRPKNQQLRWLFCVNYIFLAIFENWEVPNRRLGVAGAGIAFALQEVIASFAGWLAIMFGGFYNSETAYSWAELRAMLWILVFWKETIMEDNGLMAIYTTDGLY
jgi:Na+-driven multidrug efflux pump